VSGEPPEDHQTNNESNAQQDFSEPLDLAEAVVGEPEPEPPTTEAPAETPSTSNNALIMQIKILSEYAKDIRRSMYAVAQTADV
jgi:hypothetical protein